MARRRGPGAQGPTRTQRWVRTERGSAALARRLMPWPAESGGSEHRRGPTRVAVRTPRLNLLEIERLSQGGMIGTSLAKILPVIVTLWAREFPSLVFPGLVFPSRVFPGLGANGASTTRRPSVGMAAIQRTEPGARQGRIVYRPS